MKKNRILHVTLWLVQLLLATSLLWAASMKLFQTLDTLATMWPWTAQVPRSLVTLTGLVDVLGALGLVLPMLLHVKPVLTPLAAMGVVVLMMTASIFHIARGEASLIGVNCIFAVLAALVAWGRWTYAPTR
ncbi:DoxX family protein [Siphonobacter sp.]|uniref:DoxX family protein n=1 Tax=Siphonobacter sp. TaxID=1869184 RepID=UPI003B3B5FD6